MTAKTAKQVMERAFATLGKRRRANLRWHAEKGTTILCGIKWCKYIDGFGGG